LPSHRTMNAELFRIHPVTGTHAEDTSGYPDEAKQQLAAVMRAGGQLYWEKTEDFLAGIQGYVLVERSNIAFVVKMTGGTITIYETPPI
jgi:hypothetical protein